MATIHSPELGDVLKNPKLVFDNMALYLVHVLKVVMGVQQGHSEVLSEPSSSLFCQHITQTTNHTPHSLSVHIWSPHSGQKWTQIKQTPIPLLVGIVRRAVYTGSKGVRDTDGTNTLLATILFN